MLFKSVSGIHVRLSYEIIEKKAGKWFWTMHIFSCGCTDFVRLGWERQIQENEVIDRIHRLLVRS